jgi:small subunit ribosomal protein S6
VDMEERRRDYETMIVLRADLQEAGMKEQLERFSKLLEANGAAVRGVHEWGMRELAYPILKERRGYYALLEYTATATALAELERQLKLSDLVLRCVSVRQQYAVQVQEPSVQEGARTTEAKESNDDAQSANGAADAGDVEA